MKSTIVSSANFERAQAVRGELSICSTANPTFVVLCTDIPQETNTFSGVVVHSDNPQRKLGVYYHDFSINAFQPFYGRITLDGKE